MDLFSSSSNTDDSDFGTFENLDLENDDDDDYEHTVCFWSYIKQKGSCL